MNTEKVRKGRGEGRGSKGRDDMATRRTDKRGDTLFASCFKREYFICQVLAEGLLVVGCTVSPLSPTE